MGAEEAWEGLHSHVSPLLSAFAVLASSVEFARPTLNGRTFASQVSSLTWTIHRCTMRVDPRQGTHVNNVFYPQSFSREDDSTIPYEHEVESDTEQPSISEEEKLAVRSCVFVARLC